MIASPSTFVVVRKRYTPRGRIRYTIQFGDGAAMEVRDGTLRRERRFRNQVRARLGREFAPRSQVDWIREITDYAMRPSLHANAIRAPLTERGRKENEAAFDRMEAEYLEWLEEMSRRRKS
jgi:hypothetical protein